MADFRRCLLLPAAVFFLFPGAAAAAEKREEKLFDRVLDVEPRPIGSDPSVRWDYDIVYVRARRAGDTVHQRFYTDITPNADELAKHVTDGVRPAVSMLAKMLEGCPWTKEAVAEAVKETLRATGLKMPQLAMPVRVLVLGTAQTPSLDAVLSLSLREKVLERLRAA